MTAPHPYLQQLRSEVADNAATVARIGKMYSAAQCAWKPDPDSWSMLECIHHLIITGALYHPQLKAVLERATPEKERVSYRPTFFGKMFIKYVSPESAKKVKTFRRFEPSASVADLGILDQFQTLQDELAELIGRAEGKDLNGNRFSSPVTRFIRFTLGEGLTMLVRHQQRHLQQALRLTQHPGFPQ